MVLCGASEAPLFPTFADTFVNARALARDGRELFFRKGDRMMVVHVATGSIFSMDRPRVLFTGALRYQMSQYPGWSYDVARDGRFLMVQADEPEIRVVLNFGSELQRLARR